jgi:hypothetical protein
MVNESNCTLHNSSIFAPTCIFDFTIQRSICQNLQKPKGYCIFGLYVVG